MESGKVVKAPLFKPSLAEFSEGPFSYISKIYHSNPNLSICLIEPPLAYQPDDILDQDLLSLKPWKTNFSDKKVQAENLCSFRRFCDIGDDFKRDFFKRPPDSIPTEEVEDAFWSLQSNEQDVEVSHAFKLPMDVYRPKYLRNRKNQDDFKWSFLDLGDSNENLLKFLNNEAKKFFSPTLDIGMCFSQLDWRRELHWCVLLSYLHYGDTRICYGISPEFSEGFLANLNHRNVDISPPKYDDQSVVSLSVDISDNIQLIRAEHQAGQFLVIFPGVIYSAFDVGVNLVESIPIAPALWSKFGSQAVEQFSRARLQSFFSHEELLSQAASESDDLAIDLAKSILPELTLFLKKDSNLRCNQNISFSAIRKRAFELIPHEHRRCHICQKILFFSCISCHCSDRLVCIEHAKKVCKNCTVCVYNYRYSDDNKEALVEGLRRRLQDYEDWLSAVNLLLSSNQKHSDEELFALIHTGNMRQYPLSEPSFVKLRALEKDYKELILILESLVRQRKKHEDENIRKTKAESSLASASLSSARIKKKMEAEKENVNLSPLKTKSLKNMDVEKPSKDRQLSLAEYKDFCATVKSFPISFTHIDWLSTILDKCNVISASINRIFNSGEYATSKILQDLADDIRSVVFIDFSNELKLINSRLVELKWLEDCQSLLNDQSSTENEKVYDISTIKLMIENGLVLKSNSREIINCLNRLHKIHGDASKWINNTKVLLNIVKQAEQYWDEDASKPTIGELAALAEEIRENPGLRKVDLSPYSQELEELLTECRLWMNTVFSAMNSFRSDGKNENDIVFVNILEDLFTKGKELGCQLKDLSRLKKTLELTNSWKSQVEKVFMRKKPLYKLPNILTPLTNSLLPASVDIMTSSRCYYQQLKKQALTMGSKDTSKKSSRFERLLNGDFTQEKIRQIYYQAEEDEEIEMASVREKRILKNNEAAMGGDESSDKSSKEREKYLKKFCFCGKPIIGEWIIHCKTCQEWFHVNCVQSYLPLMHSIPKGKKQSGSVNDEAKDQFNFICPLCCRGSRPSLEALQNLIKSYLSLPVRVLEGELLLCLYERVQRYKTRLKEQINQRGDLLKAYTLAETNNSSSECSSQEVSSQSSPFKSKRKSPLVLRGELSDDPNLQLDEDSKIILWDLFCEGNLLEIFLPEVQNLWMVWHLTNPTSKAMVYIDNGLESLPLLASDNLTASSKKSGNEELEGDTERERTEAGKMRIKRKRKERSVFERSSKRRGRKSKAEDSGDNSEEICSMDKECLRPTGKVDWICCDGNCQGWFHQLCAGVTSQEVKNIEEYFCKSCRVKSEIESGGKSDSDKRAENLTRKKPIIESTSADRDSEKLARINMRNILTVPKKFSSFDEDESSSDKQILYDQDGNPDESVRDDRNLPVRDCVKSVESSPDEQSYSPEDISEMHDASICLEACEEEEVQVEVVQDINAELDFQA